MQTASGTLEKRDLSTLMVRYFQMGIETVRRLYNKLQMGQEHRN